MALYEKDGTGFKQESWKRPDDIGHPIEEFAMSMLKQLELHDDEKNIKFVTLTVDQLIELAGKEFQKRFQNASKLTDEEIEKNCEHMGNYLYFVWSQVKFRQESE